MVGKGCGITHNRHMVIKIYLLNKWMNEWAKAQKQELAWCLWSSGLHGICASKRARQGVVWRYPEYM
jgi:hypothetical protein